MKKLILLFALLCAPAFGQVYSEQAIQNTQGNWLKASPGALVYLCTAASSLADCISGVGAASLYTNQNVNVLGPNPITADSNGNFSLFANPGTYSMCVKGATTYCQLISVAGNASNHITCGAAINGSIAAFTDPTTTSCDPTLLTDFAGNLTGQSAQFLGPVNGFTTYIGGGSAPGTLVKFKLPANAFRIMAPATVGTPYYFVPPAVRCSVGQVWGLATETTDANGDKVDTYQCQNSAAGSTEVQVNGVDTTSQTPINFRNTASITCTNPSAGNIDCTASGGVTLQTNGVNNSSQTTLNNQNGVGVNVNNVSAGNVQYSQDGATQISTPTAPTLATTGVAGSTSITYVVVGCENPSCSRHTPASASTTIATANATLTSSNAVKLTAYGDTLYGPRCYDIYRTAAGGTPSTVGLIAHCVGKRFIDTGLAGDSATAPTSNNTLLFINMAALPGCNIPPQGLIGIDAPPCAPTVSDDEFQQTFGAPADVNNPLYAWINQGSATALWSSGALILTSDTTGANNLESLNSTLALPGTPWTFQVYLDSIAIQSTSGCAFGFRESSTGKMSTLLLYENTALNTTGAGGMTIGVYNWTSNTALSAVVTTSYRTEGYYFKIQDTGTNLVYSFSPYGDGINFKQVASQAVTAAFTTAPDQLILGANSSTTASTCTFDFVRRTQ